MPDADLSALRSTLRETFRLVPVMGAELEWYLRSPGDPEPLSADTLALPAFQAALARSCAEAGLSVASLDRERGPGQMELSIKHGRDVRALAEGLSRARGIIEVVARGAGLEADFSAKPFPDRFGSALHVHLHLADEAGANCFLKQEAWMSDPLRDTLAGLMSSMLEYMDVFAPHAESYARFERGFDAPLFACWGGNNRTVALRMPDMSPFPFRRIEHRVAGADADPQAVIAAILKGVLHGLERKPELPSPIYGNAGDVQYATGKELFASFRARVASNPLLPQES